VQEKEFKKTVRCFYCGMQCHFAKTYKAPKKEEKEEAHHVNQDDNFVAMLFQVTAPSNNSDWWLDTGATCHAYSNKDVFSTYVAAKKSVSMADRSTVAVLGTGTVVLTLTLETLTLKSVKHVPSIFKNLLYGSLLCDAGMRLDFQSGKVVLSYMKMYFGNAYRTDGMYKISTTVPTSVINEFSIFEYASTLWHNRLGHVNYRKILNMKKLGLLQKCGGKNLKNVKSVYKSRSQESPVQLLQGVQICWTWFIRILATSRAS